MYWTQVLTIKPRGWQSYYANAKRLHALQHVRCSCVCSSDKMRALICRGRADSHAVHPPRVSDSLSGTLCRFKEATHRTTRWIDRCIAAHARPQEQNLFGIVQGGLDRELRDISIKVRAISCWLSETLGKTLDVVDAGRKSAWQSGGIRMLALAICLQQHIHTICIIQARFAKQTAWLQTAVLCAWW